MAGTYLTTGTRGRLHTVPDVASDTVALIAATQTLTNKTITAPVLSGSVTGTYTLAGTPTLTNPAITAPTLSGSVAGTYTLAGTPTLTTPTITSPTITGGTSTGIKVIAAQSTEGAIAIAQKIVVLTHADAGAYTLAAPTVTSQDGIEIIFTTGNAFAHVITATGLLQDGVTGGAKNTATFGAYVGASLHLVAYQGTWYVISKNVCTIA